MNGVDETPLLIDCDGDQLVGILHRAPAPCTVGVLVIVGGPQYRVGSHRQFVITARDIAAQGYPVLRFDYRGMGDSDGAPRSFENIDKDITAALDDFAEASPELEQFVLLGLCDAASAAMIYCARRDPRITGLVLMNPWARTVGGEAQSYVRHYYGRRLLQRSFWRKLLGGKLSIRRAISSFYGNLKSALVSGGEGGGDSASFIDRMRYGFETFSGPVLFLISGRDLTASEFMDMSVGSRDWKALLDRDRVEIRELPEADHTFSTRAALGQSSRYCVDWLERHFPDKTGG